MIPRLRSSVPALSLESAAELLPKIRDAVRDGDLAAERRRTARLHRAIQALPALRRLSSVDAAEASQRVLVNVHRAVHGAAFDDIRELGAWIHRVVENVKHDLARERARARRFVPLDAFDESADADKSGVHRIDHLRADPERWLERTAASVGHYASLVPESGARKICVWFELRVRQRDAFELARAYDIAHRADGGRATIYQWAHRGAALLAALVAEDRDTGRAGAVEVLLANAS